MGKLEHQKGGMSKKRIVQQIWIQGNRKEFDILKRRPPIFFFFFCRLLIWPLCINKLCFTHYTERRRKTKREARKEALTADKRGDSKRRQQKGVGFFQLILSAKRGGGCVWGKSGHKKLRKWQWKKLQGKVSNKE